MKRALSAYGIAGCILFALSFGFIDPNLHIFTGLVKRMVTIPVEIVYHRSLYAACIYTVIVLVLFWGYSLVLKKRTPKDPKKISKGWYVVIGLFLLSFPAFSYDIFNYIITAKVAFLYRENPYVIMPIQIPNEPMLSFTRAANKVALYGPTWIVLTAIPHSVGFGNILASIYAFKGFVALFYGALIHLIFRRTKRWENVLFFALHPLVLIEVLVSGHNDIAMIALAYAGLMLWERTAWQYKAAGLILFVASVFVKGATIVLLPLFFLTRLTWEQKMVVAFWLSLGIFFVAPLREELYSWYAVWWITPAAFIPLKPKSLIHGLSFWFGMGLMLRYIPWIATREYGGATPVIRVVVMSIPLCIYAVRYMFGKRTSATI